MFLPRPEQAIPIQQQQQERPLLFVKESSFLKSFFLNERNYDPCSFYGYNEVLDILNKCKCK